MKTAEERMTDPTLTPAERSRAGREYMAELEADEPLEIVDPNVWFQLSSRHRTVARLPEGMDGRAAYKTVPKDKRPSQWLTTDEHVDRMAEWDAGEDYLIYGSPETKTLNLKSWEAYKKAGGNRYSTTARNR